MKKLTKKIIMVFIGVGIILSCTKNAENYTPNKPEEAVTVADLSEETESLPESMAATQEVEGKKFVRNASVEMEVADVYQATVFVENTLKEMGGFVTSSYYHSLVEEENNYPQSDEKSMLVRKYNSISNMEVRVPTEKLSDFLKILNDKSLFVKHRAITAEDVSANIKIAEMEKQRMDKHRDQLSKQTNTTNSAQASNDNERESNQQKLEELNLADRLKYSTVQIELREPKSKISQIEVPNIKNQENKYKYNFWFDVKEAFVDGFYVFQRFLVLLAEAWLFILTIIVVIFAWRNRKKIYSKLGKNKTDEQK